MVATKTNASCSPASRGAGGEPSSASWQAAAAPTAAASGTDNDEEPRNSFSLDWIISIRPLPAPAPPAAALPLPGGVAGRPNFPRRRLVTSTARAASVSRTAADVVTTARVPRPVGDDAGAPVAAEGPEADRGAKLWRNIRCDSFLIAPLRVFIWAANWGCLAAFASRFGQASAGLLLSRLPGTLHAGSCFAPPAGRGCRHSAALSA